MARATERQLDELRAEMRQELINRLEVVLREVNHLERKIDRLNLRMSGVYPELPQWQQPPLSGEPSDDGPPTALVEEAMEMMMMPLDPDRPTVGCIRGKE